ncbi:RimK family alpha-L-glutamate ligase [Candidatus Micrarchaeota archaeon]|nr:RimK family alpha-L-glutamate ligase [Candidatus Micrarchaeota archaeon]
MAQLGIVVDSITINKWETSALQQAAEHSGVSTEIVDIRKHSLDIEKKPFSFSVGLFRMARASSFEIYSSRYFEHLGIRMINNSKSVELGGNKFESLIRLKEAGIPVPRTSLVYSFESASKAVAQIGTPVVLKPVIGSYGQDVHLMKNLEMELAYLDAVPKPFVVQEYLNTGGKDYRIFVLDGKVLATVLRQAPLGEWRTNVSTGGLVKKVDLPPDVKKMAVKAAEVLGLEIAGVDIALTKKEGFNVIEVNTMPDFRGLYSATGINPADAIVRHALSLHGT